MRNIAIFGGGKMAAEIVRATGQCADFNLTALISPNRPEWLSGTRYYSSLEDVPESPDLLIDFTLSPGTFEAAHWCRARLIPLLSGTTGLSEEDHEALIETAELVPVMWAPNLSKGLNLLMKSVIEAAVALAPEAAVEILDTHHLHKKDAPSGTALLLAKAIASARKQDLNDCLNVIERDAPEQYSPGSINCISRREGEIIGDHQVRFLAGAEELLFAHSTSDRAVYAQGSIDAGLWLIRQAAGFYTSKDWLAG